MKKNIHFLALGLAFFAVSIAACKKAKDFVDPAKILPPVSTTGRSYYVSDAIGSDANNGLSLATPFKKVTTAAALTNPGDTVYLMNGIHSFVSATLSITRSGTSGKYITYKAYPGQSPKITVSGDTWNAISINASYIVMEGIEMEGNNANLTYAGALAAYNTALSSGSATTAVNAQYNTNAISIGGPAAESKLPHHITIRNCKVHDFPGGGISSIQADYTTIEGNTVYNNAWYMMYAGSGISILNPFNSDAPDITKYKNIVRNNICFTNKTTIPWVSLVPARLSDGNGIILDVNQTGYAGTANAAKAYTGRTLVENNISVNNGGSGIHSYRADHCDIINNTAYGNGTEVGYADIYAGSATDVKIANNIMYARTGGRCNSAPSAGTTVTYNNNIYFNGTVATMGTGDKVANPSFANLSTNILLANFNLTPGSPAINAGTSTIYSLKDIKGVARPLGGAVDCGAYEFQ